MGICLHITDHDGSSQQQSDKRIENSELHRLLCETRRKCLKQTWLSLPVSERPPTLCGWTGCCGKSDLGTLDGRIHNSKPSVVCMCVWTETRVLCLDYTHNARTRAQTAFRDEAGRDADRRHDDKTQHVLRNVGVRQSVGIVTLDRSDVQQGNLIVRGPPGRLACTTEMTRIGYDLWSAAFP